MFEIKKNKLAKKYLTLCVLTSILTLIGNSANALTISGDIQEITAPSSIVLGEVESNNTIFLLKEQEGLLLTSNLTVDVVSPGTYGTNANPNKFPQGTLSSGILVDSWFLHSDPINNILSFYNGTVTFDQEIVGIIFNSNRLVNTHDLLGGLNTSYDQNFFNIFGSDQFILSSDLRTLTINSAANTGADNLRVLTKSTVPEPLTILGAGTAVAFGTSFKRKLSKAKKK